MSVYKIFTNKDNEINNISCYIKNILIENDIDLDQFNVKFSQDPNNDLFEDIFSREELEFIKDNSIKTNFINEQINFDDSIEIIKKKIMENNPDLSFKEIYLYAQTEKIINNVEIFQELTQNGKIEITEDRLISYLLNIGIKTNPLPSKSHYNYEDIISLNLDKKKVRQNIPIGQQFTASINYIYTVNPFDVVIYDKFLENYAEVITSTSNQGLLLESPTIDNNIIYLCSAKDVLQYNIEKSLSEKSCIKIYYPFLNQNEIYTLDTLNKKQQELLIDSEKYINEKFTLSNNVIDLFYNLKVNPPIEYSDTGIQLLEFVINPLIVNNIPLDVIFKLIHATKEYPMIKYNPGKKLENIYRFYIDKISRDGRKIPYLSKGTIFKLIKSIGKTKRVSVYIEFNHNKEIIPIICEFDQIGSIYISIEFKKLYELSIINNIISDAINPLINIIKGYLEQSGYKIENFKDINSSNIEITNLVYVSSINPTGQFKITPYTSCMSEIFNIINPILDQGIILRFKKVSYYNEYDAIESFILDLLNKQVEENEIIERLIDNFKLTNEEAKVQLATLLTSLQVVQNLYQSNKYKIKNNPGFLTTIQKDKFTGKINFRMEGINNFNYLYTIPYYINSLFIIGQNLSDTNISTQDILSLCNNKSKGTDLDHIDEIIPKHEESFPEHEELILEKDQEIQFSPDDDDDKKLLDILFLGDSDSEEEDELEVEEEEKIKSPVDEIRKEKEEEEGEGEEEAQQEGREEGEEQAEEEKSEEGEEEGEGREEGEEEREEIESLKSNKLSEKPEEIIEELDIIEPDFKSESDDSKSDKEEELKSFDLEKLLSNASSLSSNKSDKSSKSKDSVKSLESLESLKLDDISPISSPVTSRPKIGGVGSEKDVLSSLGSLSSISDGSISEKSLSKKISPEKEEIPPKKLSITVKKTKIKSEQAKSPEKSPEKDKKTTISVKKSKNPLSSQQDKIKDLTGMSLSNPNPFYKRLESRDPKLFKTEIDKKFSAYSRICPSHIRRQPVILTDKEKEEIDKNHAGSYDKAIKYGTSKDNEFWYICPRYWSLADGVSLTEEQVKSGKYGKIIPHNAKKISEGENIYEFTDPKYHMDSKGDYINLNPGFEKEDKHPEGYCLPCCFKSWSSKEQVRRRELCINQDKGNIEKKEKEKIKINPKAKLDEYIIGPDKFPIPLNRWGYLPLSIQKFLDVDNKQCQVSKTNTALKPFTPCLLRYGVEQDKNQSFIACLANVYSDFMDGKVLTIKDMKKIIKNAITLDNFMNYNNGNLIQLFEKKDKVIDVEKYSDSQIYKNIDKKDNKQLIFFKRLVAAFENFLEFMDQDDIIIDYNYLWDIVSTPNPKLFPNGINLIILNMVNDDITDNVSIICPTIAYSNEPFSMKKVSLILIKSSNYYEPIYLIEDTKKQIKLTKLLSSNTISNNIKNILETIKTIINTYCKPLPSLPEVYKFSTNLSSIRVYNLLIGKKYEITKQIINFNGQVIGLIANKDSLEGFVPTEPSGKLEELDIEFMDEDIWKNYNETKDFLNNVSIATEDRIKCKPLFKVIEDNLIVGILTNANQFVSISPPTQDIFGNDLKIINDNNYTIADDKLETSDKDDENRVKTIQFIRLESEFFNIFRNQVRITLGEFKNQFKRKTVEELVNQKDILYLVKIKKIASLLKKTIKNVIFSTYTMEVLENIGNITNCLNADLCKDKEFCYVTSDDECKLVIPKKNLITGEDNEDIYFVRIADELIRYKRISQFIFEPVAYLSFAKIKYNLNEDEILMLQSLITQQYFERLDIINTNSFIKNSTYNTAYPNKSKFYSNEISNPNPIEKKRLKLKKKEEVDSVEEIQEVEEKVGDTEGIEDIEETIEVKKESPDLEEIKESQLVELDITSDKEVNCPINKKNLVGKWRTSFPGNTIEIFFTCEQSICTYELILYILKDYSEENKLLTKTKLKMELVLIYQNYEEMMDILFKILESQGKGSIIKLVKNGIITMEDLLLSEDYYLTNLDFALIAIHYNIPLIFLSSTLLVENNKSFMIVNSTNNEDFYFVRTPGVRTEGLPVQRLFDSNGGLIPLRNLKEKFKKEIEEKIGFNYINDYLKIFEKKAREKKIIIIPKKKIKDT